MKYSNVYLLIAIIFWTSAINLYSQGYIVTNGVTRYDGYPSPGIEIDVLYNPSTSPPTIADYTGIVFIPETDNMFRYSYLATVDIRTFFVTLDDPVTLDAIQSGNYTELISGNEYVFNSGVAFYVGVYTGRGMPASGVFTDPVFGWAALVNNNGQMELLDSALEYKGAGIYAGTLNIIQPVPEPSTVALTALGGLLLLLRKRQSQ